MVKSMRKRVVSVIALLLTCTMLLSACGGPADSNLGNNTGGTDGTADPQSSNTNSEHITPGTIAATVDENAESSKDTLVLRMASDPGSLSPIGTSSYALEMLSLVSMPLLWPTDPDGKGESLVWSINEKSLLDAYEWSDDNMTLYLTIKEGV